MCSVFLRYYAHVHAPVHVCFMFMCTLMYTTNSISLYFVHIIFVIISLFMLIFLFILTIMFILYVSMLISMSLPCPYLCSCNMDMDVVMGVNMDVNIEHRTWNMEHGHEKKLSAWMLLPNRNSVWHCYFYHLFHHVSLASAFRHHGDSSTTSNGLVHCLVFSYGNYLNQIH